MKTKARLHSEVIEILNKPGRWMILRQYSDGGPVWADTNGPDPTGGPGYPSKEAALSVLNKSKGDQ